MKTSWCALSAAAALMLLSASVCKADCLIAGSFDNPVCIRHNCPPDRECRVFEMPIKGRNAKICACLPPEQPPIAGVFDAHSSFTSTSTVALASGILGFTGDVVTGSSFPADPIVGAPIAFSNTFDLLGTRAVDGIILGALFTPRVPTTIRVGDLFSGTVDSVVYVQTDLDEDFDVLFSNLTPGPDAGRSPFVRELFAPETVAFGLSFEAPRPLFSEIAAGSFGPLTMTNLGVTAVPEPAGLVMAGTAAAAGLIELGRRRGRRRRGA